MRSNPHHLNRKSLPEQVADQIEAELRSSASPGKLPGYRTLAARYDVGWGTVIAALKLLEERGAVSCSQAGQSRKVIAKDDSSDISEENLLILSDKLFWSESDSTAMIREIAHFWEGQWGMAIWKVVDLARYRQPERQLRKLIERHRAGALLLCVSPATWIRAGLAVGIPTYHLGGEIMEFDKLAGSGYRLSTSVKAAVAHLRDLGHERILVPSQQVGPEMRSSLIQGMSAAFDGALGDEELNRWCPIFTETVPSVWQSYWKRSFEKMKPTAVVTIYEPFVLSLYGFCASCGLSIPEDVSVIFLGSSEQLKWCHPQPSMMAYPSAKSIAHFKRWARGGFRARVFKLLPMAAPGGASVAPPRK